MGSLIVEFEDWEKGLRNTVSAPLQAGYCAAIVNFRYWLVEKGQVASVDRTTSPAGQGCGYGASANGGARWKRE